MTDLPMTGTHCTQCGQPFYILQSLWDALKRAGGSLCCPNGHTMTFGKSEKDQLRHERDAAVEQLERIKIEHPEYFKDANVVPIKAKG
jgi:uncharacterized Zn finger protein (UPF0148 family)